MNETTAEDLRPMSNACYKSNSNMSVWNSLFKLCLNWICYKKIKACFSGVCYTIFWNWPAFSPTFWLWSNFFTWTSLLGGTQSRTLLKIVMNGIRYGSTDEQFNGFSQLFFLLSGDVLAAHLFVFIVCFLSLLRTGYLDWSIIRSTWYASFKVYIVDCSSML